MICYEAGRSDYLSETVLFKIWKNKQICNMEVRGNEEIDRLT